MEQLDFEHVFTFNHLMSAYKRCRKNVNWKVSIQLFNQNKGLNIIRLYHELQSGTYVPKNLHEFDIYDRGKKRHIKSVSVKDRVVQRCLCDYYLVPLLTKSLIYDNGASLKNKGYSFAIYRMERHLRRYYFQHRKPGYILKCDITKYFDSINHEYLISLLSEKIKDDRLLQLVIDIVALSGEVGLNVGSQVSQILAVYTLNPLDHLMKDVFGYDYARYMDDFYILEPNKQILKNALLNIEMHCERAGLRLNKKKTRITKMNSVEFLKIKWTLRKDGYILKKPVYSTIVRARRKFKKLHKKFIRGEIDINDVYQSWQSWDAHISEMNSYHARKEIRALFAELFEEDPYEIYKNNKRRKSNRRRKRSHIC